MDLSRCSGVRVAPVLEAIALLQNLRVLNVSGTKLAHLPPLRKLEVLHAEGTRVTSAAVTQLSHHSRFLRELYLTQTEVDVDMCSALCIMPRLEALSIAACPRLTAGAATTRGSPRVVDFFERHFFELPTQRLRWLDVSMVAAGDDFARRALERFPALEFLGVGSTRSEPRMSPLPSRLTRGVQIGCHTQGFIGIAVLVVNSSLCLHRNHIQLLLRDLYLNTPRGGEIDAPQPLLVQLLAKLTAVAWHLMKDNSIILLTTAIMYYVLQQLGDPDLLQERREALCVVKRVLAIHSDESQLCKNASLILLLFDPTRETAEFATEIAGNLMAAILRHDDTCVCVCECVCACVCVCVCLGECVFWVHMRTWLMPSPASLPILTPSLSTSLSLDLSLDLSRPLSTSLDISTSLSA